MHTRIIDANETTDASSKIWKVECVPSLSTSSVIGAEMRCDLCGMHNRRTAAEIAICVQKHANMSRAVLPVLVFPPERGDSAVQNLHHIRARALGYNDDVNVKPTYAARIYYEYYTIL